MRKQDENLLACLAALIGMLIGDLILAVINYFFGR